MIRQGLTIGVHTPNFIGVRMSLDMRTLSRTLICSLWVFKVHKIFLVLIILYCLEAYCYIFDFKFTCLSLEEIYSLLFKSLLLYIWLLGYLFVLERDIFFTVYICFKENLFFNYFKISFIILLYNYFKFMVPRQSFLKVSKTCLK